MSGTTTTKITEKEANHANNLLKQIENNRLQLENALSYYSVRLFHTIAILILFTCIHTTTEAATKKRYVICVYAFVIIPPNEGKI